MIDAVLSLAAFAVVIVVVFLFLDRVVGAFK